MLLCSEIGFFPIRQKSSRLLKEVPLVTDLNGNILIVSPWDGDLVLVAVRYILSKIILLKVWRS
jgi:hypothetical protein